MEQTDLNNNEKALEYFNKNTNLQNLMLQTLNKTIENLTINKVSSPFLVSKDCFFEPATGDSEEALRQIKEKIPEIESPHVVYSITGTLGSLPQVNWETQKAIFINGFDITENIGILLVQMYKPKNELDDFELLGNGMVQFIPTLKESVKQ